MFGRTGARAASHAGKAQKPEQGSVMAESLAGEGAAVKRRTPVRVSPHAQVGTTAAQRGTIAIFPLRYI